MNYTPKIITTDTHIHFHSGLDIFVQSALAVLQESREIAVVNGYDYYHLGDFFQLKDTMHGIILCKTMEEIEKFKDLKTWFLFGNHDIIVKEDASYNMMRLFKAWVNVVMPYQKVIEGDFCLHFLSYRFKFMEYVTENIQLERGKTNILLFHDGIHGFWYNNVKQSTNSLTRGWLKDFGFDHVISGHFHKRQMTKFVSYVGSSHEQSWHDAGNPMGYTIMDLEKYGTPEFLVQHEFKSFKFPKHVQINIEDVPAAMNDLTGSIIRIVATEEQKKAAGNSRLHKIKHELLKRNYEAIYYTPTEKERITNAVKVRQVTKTNRDPVSILRNYLDIVDTGYEGKSEELLDYIVGLK